MNKYVGVLHLHKYLFKMYPSKQNTYAVYFNLFFVEIMHINAYTSLAFFWITEK